MDLISVSVFTIAIFALVVLVYNQFISLSNQTKNAWSDIDVLLKRRQGLVPNLVEIVKQYAKHESDVFEKVTKARTNAMTSGSIEEKSKTESTLTAALKTVFAVAEDYPELKASDNYKDLSQKLTETENDIAASRRFYNANVRELNTKIEMFPYNLLAKIFGFNKYDFFEGNEQDLQDINI